MKSPFSVYAWACRVIYVSFPVPKKGSGNASTPPHLRTQPARTEAGWRRGCPFIIIFSFEVACDRRAAALLAIRNVNDAKIPGNSKSHALAGVNIPSRFCSRFPWLPGHCTRIWLHTGTSPAARTLVVHPCRPGKPTRYRTRCRPS
jgi:hypothetical protein